MSLPISQEISNQNEIPIDELKMAEKENQENTSSRDKDTPEKKRKSSKIQILEKFGPVISPDSEKQAEFDGKRRSLRASTANTTKLTELKAIKKKTTTEKRSSKKKPKHSEDPAKLSIKIDQKTGELNEALANIEKTMACEEDPVEPALESNGYMKMEEPDQKQEEEAATVPEIVKVDPNVTCQNEKVSGKNDKETMTQACEVPAKSGNLLEMIRNYKSDPENPAAKMTESEHFSGYSFNNLIVQQSNDLNLKELKYPFENSMCYYVMEPGVNLKRGAMKFIIFSGKIQIFTEEDNSIVQCTTGAFVSIKSDKCQVASAEGATLIVWDKAEHSPATKGVKRGAETIQTSNKKAKIN